MRNAERNPFVGTILGRAGRRISVVGVAEALKVLRGPWIDDTRLIRPTGSSSSPDAMS
jgi:hypothetical protein